MSKDKVYSFRVDHLTEKEIELVAKARGVSPGILIRDLLHKQIEGLLEETKSLTEKTVDELLDDAEALIRLARERIKPPDSL